MKTMGNEKKSAKNVNQEINSLKNLIETVYYSNQEINNSLAIILTAAEWLLDNPDSSGEDSDRNLRIIINSVERISIILKNSENLMEPVVLPESERKLLEQPLRLERPINVLVVDDEPQFRLLLDKALEKVGYTVMTAINGEEALELFKKNKFDLVITDVHMPKVDGIQLVNSIKDENPWVPIIIISGFEEEVTIRKKIKRDDICFLRKPFMVRDLEKIIEKALNLNR